MNAYAQKEQKASSEKDKTGIPAQMKAKFERSSGFSFDDVRVHYNSEKPAQLHAHAYTQGSEVFVAPGQEKHLPHELGHVVQQKSNEVKPTGEVGGMPLNDDEAMESGADKLAEEAESSEDSDEVPLQAKAKDGGVVQMDAGQDSYNWTAGLAMTGVALAALIYEGIHGGVAASREKENRYVEEIEKYSDAACEASEEYAAQNEVAKDQSADPADKAKAKAEKAKLKVKAERNYFAAIDKAIVLEKPKETPPANTTAGVAPTLRRYQRVGGLQAPQQAQQANQQGQVQQANQQGQAQQQNQQGQAQQQQATQQSEAEKIRKGDFSLIKNKDVKFALERAKQAVEDCQDAPAAGGGVP